MQGRLRQRSFETKEGEKRTVVELDVDEIGPSLRYATAKVNRAGRSSGGTPSDGAWERTPAVAGTADPPFRPRPSAKFRLPRTGKQPLRPPGVLRVGDHLLPLRITLSGGKTCVHIWGSAAAVSGGRR